MDGVWWNVQKTHKYWSTQVFRLLRFNIGDGKPYTTSYVKITLTGTILSCYQFEFFGCSLSAKLDLACHMPLNMVAQEPLILKNTRKLQTFISDSSSIDSIILRRHIDSVPLLAPKQTLVWAGKYSGLFQSVCRYNDVR